MYIDEKGTHKVIDPVRPVKWSVTMRETRLKRTMGKQKTHFLLAITVDELCAPLETTAYPAFTTDAFKINESNTVDDTID